MGALSIARVAVPDEYRRFSGAGTDASSLNEHPLSGIPVDFFGMDGMDRQ